MPVNRLQKQVDGCSVGFGITVKPVALSASRATERRTRLAENALGVSFIDARARKSGSEH